MGYISPTRAIGFSCWRLHLIRVNRTIFQVIIHSANPYQPQNPTFFKYVQMPRAHNRHYRTLLPASGAIPKLICQHE